MKAPKLFAILLLTLLGICSAAIASDNTAPKAMVYRKASVYLFHWAVISNRVRSLEETRQTHSEYLELSDSNLIKDFVTWLNTGSLKPTGNPIQHQALLVVDLVREDGSTDTYYSDGCFLYSGDSKYFRSIDQTFRKQFDFYGNDMIWKTPDKTYNLCGQ